MVPLRKRGEHATPSGVRSGGEDVTIRRNMSTPANRAFWKDVEKVAAEVRSWPDWKRAGINVTDRRIEVEPNRPRPPMCPKCPDAQTRGVKCSCGMPIASDWQMRDRMRSTGTAESAALAIQHAMARPIVPIEQITFITMASLEKRTAAERVAVWEKLFERWCRHCGDEQPDDGYGRRRSCQCMNDE